MTTRRIAPNLEVPLDAFLVPRDNEGTQVLTLGEFATLGRQEGNSICLADPFVSGRHARIERRPEGFVLKDLQSQNGTLLNGSRIREAWLNPGDRIQIGNRRFEFVTEAPTTDIPRELQSKNAAWAKQLRSLPAFSQTDLPVLLLGASGCGKEVIARLVHQFSSRKSGPFVSVNCSALSESLIESELFGHRKGSFTGALADRAGAFESARGGTLFLDEIGDLPISLQPKLLRALENHEIRPLGSDQNVQTNVRIIAATHKNLVQQVTRGSFRADLFFRLNVIKVYIPLLRDRIEDFEDLLYSFCREMRVGFSFGAIQAMKDHSWPGNIRELRNIVARASALFPGQQIDQEQVRSLIDPVSLPLHTDPLAPQSMSNGAGSQMLARNYLQEVEKELIVKRLILNEGNQRRTAADLGIPKSTLHDKIKSFQIDIHAILSQPRLE